MGLFDGRGALDALEDLLERERALILRGDIDGVTRLTHEKERLITRLARGPLARPGLGRLSDMARRNGELLEASARGFKAVQARLENLSNVQEELATYGRDGARAPLAQRSTDLSKRA